MFVKFDYRVTARGRRVWREVNGRKSGKYFKDTIYERSLAKSQRWVSREIVALKTAADCAGIEITFEVPLELQAEFESVTISFSVVDIDRYREIANRNHMSFSSWLMRACREKEERWRDEYRGSIEGGDSPG